MTLPTQRNGQDQPRDADASGPRNDSPRVAPESGPQQDGNVVDASSSSAPEQPRRMLLQSIAGLGLANVALSFLGSKGAAVGGADDDSDQGNDCGKPNEDGGVIKDAACNVPVGKADGDCGLPNENGDPFSDDRCGQPIPHTPGAWADLDCATPLESEQRISQDGDCSLPTPLLPKRHKDSSCGQLVPGLPNKQLDLSCAKPSAQGGPVHNDSDCGLTIAGVKQKDDDCGLPTTGGVHTDDY